MKKCILLLPTRFNDGSEIPPATIQRALREIDTAFDGHSIGGMCDGTYKMDDGTMSNDRSLIVWVAIDADRVEELKAMARRFAALLKQESLYFEVTDAEVELLRPSLFGETR